MFEFGGLGPALVFYAVIAVIAAVLLTVAFWMILN